MNCYKCATPLPDNSKFCMACGADVSGDHTHHTGAIQPDPELLNALQAELGDDYRVEKELGRGGMAIVFLGHDKHLGRKVAIKLLPPMLTFGSGPGFIDRFKREARTAATLDHPHIIPVYRVSTGGKLFWYVMKFLPGESLDTTLKRDGQFDVDRVVQIITQTADALDYAHQNKVVHRDVKPANIMLDQRGRVTVTDFGIAKALEATAYTNSGATIGTPHYMAPEQCAGLPLSGAADQYALAVSAYQMLSGHLPFSAESVLELMRMHSQDPPPPLATLRPSLSAELVAAVERGLAKEPVDRFPTCADFAKALADAAAKMDEAARRPTTGIGTGTAAAIRLNTPRARTVPEKRDARPHVRSRRILFGSAGGVAVAALTAVLLWGQFDWPTSGSSPENAGEQPGAAGSTGPTGRTDTTNTTDTSGAAATAGNVGATGTGAPETATTQKGAAAESTKLASPQPPRPARLTLRGTPAGATVTRDGARVSGSTFDLQPGRQTVVVVSAAGFESWRESFTPAAGDQLTRTVALRRIARADTAYLTVGSTPQASILINGKPVDGNPLTNYPVTAGRVVITFQVTDTSVWTVDTVITLAPGERRNLRRITLRRP